MKSIVTIKISLLTSQRVDLLTSDTTITSQVEIYDVLNIHFASIAEKNKVHINQSLKH